MIVIVNTGIGNFKSIQNMLLRIGVKSIISACSDKIMSASKLILPGIGSFDTGMSELNKNNLVDVIKYKVLNEDTNILGICLGMQMLGDGSEEGSLNGLGLIRGKVKKFNFTEEFPKNKIPHMGWNYVSPKKGADLFHEFDSVPRFYFTHSYYFDCQDDNNVIGSTSYGIVFDSAIQKKNIYGVQFHPEKSHRFGMQLLKNFST